MGAGRRSSSSNSVAIEGFQPRSCRSAYCSSNAFCKALGAARLDAIIPVGSASLIANCLIVRCPVGGLCRDHDGVMRIVILVFVIVCTLFFDFLLVCFCEIRGPLGRVLGNTLRFTGKGLACAVPMSSRSRVKCLSRSLGCVTSGLGGGKRCRQRFVSGISRSFHSPLASVGNCIRTVLSNAVPPRVRRHCLGIVTFRSAHLRGLAQDLLALGRLSIGGHVVRVQHFSVGRAVHAATTAFRKAYSRQGVHLRLLLTKGRLFIHTSVRRVRRMLCGLLSGTMGFDDSGSSVALRAAIGRNGIFISIGSRKDKVPGRDLSEV